MKAPGDLLGKPPFGRLTVIARANDDRNGAKRWQCRCTCGQVVIVRGENLTSGSTKSCGCLRAEIQHHRAIDRNRIAPRDGAGRLAGTRTAKKLRCPECGNRKVLALYGDGRIWLCRSCTNQRLIAASMGKREPRKAPAPSAESRPETTDGAPTLCSNPSCKAPCTGREIECSRCWAHPRTGRRCHCARWRGP